ncbi:hypothetical protein RND81_04G143200 [Saponaria officinalis]|uniref:Uncharacterized protein n=1 Tax=Saponaria officinalis TaxID=3572 RepID=A0AAW1LLZ6_SAPOF
MMKKTSKELLQFEHQDPSSFKDNALLVCGNTKNSAQIKPPNPLFNAPLPSSQVLGKVKDFLGVISEANKNLELQAKEKPEDFNIETLNGNESELIEMDLMLGVADLHTPEAMAAAEAALAGNQPILDLYNNDDSSESETSSDDDDDDDSDDDELMQDDSPVKQQSSSNKKKRSKIVELS